MSVARCVEGGFFCGGGGGGGKGGGVEVDVLCVCVYLCVVCEYLLMDLGLFD